MSDTVRTANRRNSDSRRRRKFVSGVVMSSEQRRRTVFTSVKGVASSPVKIRISKLGGILSRKVGEAIPVLNKSVFVTCKDCGKSLDTAEEKGWRKYHTNYVCIECWEDKPVKNATTILCLKCGKPFRSRSAKFNRVCRLCRIENASLPDIRYRFSL